MLDNGVASDKSPHPRKAPSPGFPANHPANRYKEGDELFGLARGRC